MSKLEYYARPLVAFDASNPVHREFYYEFLERRSWGYCPVRFIVPDMNGMDLIRMIQLELLQYYVKKEFKGKKVEKSTTNRRRKVLGLTNGGHDAILEV